MCCILFLIKLFSVMSCLAYVIFHTVEEGRVGFVFAGFCRDFLLFWSLRKCVWEGSSSDHKLEAKGWTPSYFSVFLLQWRALALSALQSSGMRGSKGRTEMDSSDPWKVSKSILTCWGEALRHCSDKSLIEIRQVCDVLGRWMHFMSSYIFQSHLFLS